MRRQLLCTLPAVAVETDILLTDILLPVTVRPHIGGVVWDIETRTTIVGDCLHELP